VSELHANFIVNRGGASAQQVERLIRTLQARVEQAHGIRLEPEVRILGESLPEARHE
jgi:UDP-N-acetylmuramate dehydrogenase